MPSSVLSCVNLPDPPRPSSEQVFLLTPSVSLDVKPASRELQVLPEMMPQAFKLCGEALTPDVPVFVGRASEHSIKVD